MGTLVSALYDYNPMDHSPNEEDASDELAFHVQDVMKIVESMDEDGFYQCEMVTTGQVGFVPSNFIERIEPSEVTAPASGGAAAADSGKKSLFKGFRSKFGSKK